MARLGYIEARKARDAAVVQVHACEISLDNVEQLDYIPELKDIHRKDRQKNLEAAKAELERAEEAFALFDVQPEKPIRKYFDYQIQARVSVDTALHKKMICRQEEQGITMAELFRRALTEYLK